ncbi:lipase family protein [Kribbella sp. NPDC023972]|uniref:lipase family protein n=1 Tax=Kribbella sp. NPDC023972 TaxID=3154795 RepID=UPI0033F0BFB2
MRHCSPARPPPPYSPDLKLVGVAAGARPADLPALLDVNLKTLPGKVLVAMLLQSWSEVYDDASIEKIVKPGARPSISIAGYCLFKQFLAAVPSALLLDLTFISNAPVDTEPWKTHFAANAPGGQRTGVPILMTQGEADPIIAPAVTTKLAQMLCTSGKQLQLRTYPGVEHVDAGFKAAPDVAAWIADRFAGKPAPTTCT